ncbi:hypothetical protein Daura_28265 [Dactylosporangium aurantiacum]|uniref:Uncharacterized protein n=1 Tax=Dactylosporangium aurantiacum TaxID=35754 RepID=A0A9Q9IVA0_9ACTN|nr:hypothetical protein [Dactylosporangium aurantiacum]MDG6106925.1 hypothetical protein [Dactylosporangium aurantiacum]UWZ60244.1 hypothetical protein Daura_28265 [Dactylosporangium aurantiacum]
MTAAFLHQWQVAMHLLGLTAQIDLGVTRGLLNEYVRHVLSNEIGDWLRLPRDYAAAPGTVGHGRGSVPRARTLS